MPSSLFPVLSTKRLLLRSLQPTDDTALFALRSNEEVNKYLDRAMPDRIEDVGEFIRKIIRQTERGICWYWVDLPLEPVG
jgi:ribosomal-protein-alanine N-acetyltransferase